jgi:hypothetical protein
MLSYSGLIIQNSSFAIDGEIFMVLNIKINITLIDFFQFIIFSLLNVNPVLKFKHTTYLFIIIDSHIESIIEFLKFEN